jgi:hypothetical protein
MLNLDHLKRKRHFMSLRQPWRFLRIILFAVFTNFSIFPATAQLWHENARDGGGCRYLTSSPISIQTEFASKSFFRGVPRIGSSAALGGGLEISALGWSGGMNWLESTGDGGGEGTAFFGYSYPLGSFDLSAGLYGTWVNNSRFDDTLEAYVSIASDPLWLGISPSFTYYLRLDEARGGYGELKLTRLWTLANDKLDIAPYALFSFGDYYTSSYSANHSELGIGAAYHVNDHLSIGLSTALISAFNDAESLSGHSTDGQFNLSVRYRF